MNNKFIYTKDEGLKDKLLKLGYRLLQEISDQHLYIFENKSTFQFDLKDSQKYILCNTLMF